MIVRSFFFFFQAEDGIRDVAVTGVQTCALPISASHGGNPRSASRCKCRSDGVGLETESQFSGPGSLNGAGGFGGVWKALAIGKSSYCHCRCRATPTLAGL